MGFNWNNVNIDPPLTFGKPEVTGICAGKLEATHPTPWRIEGDKYNYCVLDAKGGLIFGYSSDEGQLCGPDRENFLDEMILRVNAGAPSRSRPT